MNRKLAGLLALAMLAACGGGGGNAGSITPAAPGPQSANVSSSANGVHLTPFHGAPALANFEWGKAMLERMHFVAPTQVGALAVDVQVRMRDPHGLAMYALSASDPKSPNFRRFLTPQEIGDRFGASKDDYESVARYFAKLGMHVGMWPQREVLSVTGTLPQFSRAFQHPVRNLHLREADGHRADGNAALLDGASGGIGDASSDLRLASRVQYPRHVCELRRVYTSDDR